MILNTFFFFVPFFRGLEFWELKFRGRSFVYRQVLFGAVFSTHFTSKNRRAAITTTIDRFSNVASLGSAICVAELVLQLRDTHRDLASERKGSVFFV